MIVSPVPGAHRSRRSHAAAENRLGAHAPGADSGVGLAADSGAGLAGGSGAGLAADSGAGVAGDIGFAAASGRGLAPAGPGIPPGPTGPVDEGFSPQASPRVPSPFHFVVHTELVVYGATEPGATLTVQGSPVALRPDGTFSLRFQLPDGEQVLRAVAVSGDGKVERVITPVVTRRTVEQETRRDEG
jgi:hypothetical protein